MVICGDSLEALKTLEPNSVDAVVTDPPYGLSFMGKQWDYDVPQVELWQEVYRVLKPGGHLLSFAGTRTQHRMAVNIEDAGFEIRDMIAWVYGSGFPKSLNIGKVMDKYLKTGNASWNGTGDSSNGALGYSKLQHNQGYRPADYSNKHQNKEEITEDLAKKWEGWGTALKPALEPITVARKPIEGTVANNVLKYGTGGLNIDGSRVAGDMGADRALGKPRIDTDKYGKANSTLNPQSPLGRFPANLIHDGSDEVVGLFPDTGKSTGGRIGNKGSMINTMGNAFEAGDPGYGDSGSAARFFYTAKASKSERNKGLEGFEDRIGGGMAGTADKTLLTGSGNERNNVMKNHHPTVKPIKLMQYLVKLVTPKGGTVLDPFTGSGTTGIACKLEGFEFIGIEREQEYVDIANARIEAWEEPKQESLL